MDYHLKIEYKDALHFIIEIAKHDSSVTFEEIEEWIKKHLVPVPENYKNDTEKYLNNTILDIKDGTEN